MLGLIGRLGGFGINVVVSSHVLTDIERTCNWVVLLDAGNLVRSGPLESGGDLGSVTIEVIDRAEELISWLNERGLEASGRGRAIVVSGADQGIETTIVEGVAAVGAGLARLIRGASSLEDEFLSRARQ
jgi:ABC-2 type transport system ATP-binding protein